MNYKVFLGVVALMGASVYGAGQPSAGGVANQAPAPSVWDRLTGKVQSPVVNSTPPAGSGVMVQNPAPVVSAPVVLAGSEAACKSAVEAAAAGIRNVKFSDFQAALKAKFSAGVPANCHYVRAKHFPLFSSNPNAGQDMGPLNLEHYINEVAKMGAEKARKEDMKMLSDLKASNKAAYDVVKAANKKASQEKLPVPAAAPAVVVDQKAVDAKAAAMAQIKMQAPAVAQNAVVPPVQGLMPPAVQQKAPPVAQTGAPNGQVPPAAGPDKR